MEELKMFIISYLAVVGTFSICALIGAITYKLIKRILNTKQFCNSFANRNKGEI